MSQRIEQLDRNFAPDADTAGIRWHDASAFDLHGRGWKDVETWTDRLPLGAKELVTPAMWSLSQHTAGLCIRFSTNSARIAARWRLRFDQLAMHHMPSTGVSGLDLYIRQATGWRWVGAAKAIDWRAMSQVLLEAEPLRRDYAMWLPLYNGIESLEIGIDPGAELFAPASSPPNAPRIVFYGTSIVQGGCASRPGMAYPAILSRWLNIDTINLGFSGNGGMALAVARLLAEIDASIFVIDSLPNMNSQQVAEVAEPFVRILRQGRPLAHIILVENIIYQNTIDAAGEARHRSKNLQLRLAYERLLHDGIEHVHYVAADLLLGNDWEATVDGTHLTDLGFYRLSQALLPLLQRLTTGDASCP